MQRWLIGVAAGVGLIASGAYAFREPLLGAMFERVTADMFVAKDDDPYDPGLAIGAQLPALRARYAGHEITDVAAFMGANGLALFVNRSVDW
jgi:hypothetical protein